MRAASVRDAWPRRRLVASLRGNTATPAGLYRGSPNGVSASAKRRPEAAMAGRHAVWRGATRGVARRRMRFVIVLVGCMHASGGARGVDARSAVRAGIARVLRRVTGDGVVRIATFGGPARRARGRRAVASVEQPIRATSLELRVCLHRFILLAGDRVGEGGSIAGILEIISRPAAHPGITSVLQPNSRLILLPSGAAETLSQLSGQRMMFFGSLLLS